MPKRQFCRLATVCIAVVLLLPACGHSDGAPLVPAPASSTRAPRVTNTPVTPTGSPPSTDTPLAPAKMGTLTNTPLPAADLPVSRVCPIVATRTPPPGAPTYVPMSPNETPGYVDPHVEICSSSARVQVGDTVTVMGEPVGIGLPYFTLHAVGPGAAPAVSLGEVTYDNEFRPSGEHSDAVELVSATGDMHEVAFELRALRPGPVNVWIAATGEVHYGYPGPATWAGGGSDTILITISQ